MSLALSPGHMEEQSGRVLIVYMCVTISRKTWICNSVILRLFPPPVFVHLQYAKAEVGESHMRDIR